jgi:hypothetical protein
VCESIGGGGQQSIIVQNNSGVTIRNVAISNSINLETRTAGGASGTFTFTKYSKVVTATAAIFFFDDIAMSSR